MRERPQIESPEIDALETQWWNDYAPLVETIWAQPPAIRRAVRGHYLQRARQFFLEGATQLPMTVLEIGCGSGWVGHMLAERGKLHIVGMDISEEQVAMAQRHAIKLGLGDICHYTCENLRDYKSPTGTQRPGVLVQAILHHLSWTEIKSVLREIAALGSGTRIFIYEPAYVAAQPGVGPLVVDAATRVLTLIPKVLARLAVVDQSRALNRELRQQVLDMCQLAVDKGWMLSPKEVIFQEADLLAALNEHFSVQNRYIGNFTAVGAAQTAVFYDSPVVEQRFTQQVLPFAVGLDNALFKAGMSARGANWYFFMCYECVVK